MPLSDKMCSKEKYTSNNEKPSIVISNTNTLFALLGIQKSLLRAKKNRKFSVNIYCVEHEYHNIRNQIEIEQSVNKTETEWAQYLLWKFTISTYKSRNRLI